MHIEDFSIIRGSDGTRTLVVKSSTGSLWGDGSVASFASTPEGIESADMLDALLKQFTTGDNFAMFWGIRQKMHNAQMVKTGFNDKPFNFGEAIALIHSELSEALEYDRKGDGKSSHIPEFTGVEEELADAILRIMHLASMRNLRVAEAVTAKMAFNATRPPKHGGKAY